MDFGFSIPPRDETFGVIVIWGGEIRNSFCLGAHFSYSTGRGWTA